MSTTTQSSSLCYAVTTDETPKSKLERIMMDTEEDLKFRMDEMAAEASMVSSVDENKSVESECSRTESERATDSPDLHAKVYRQPSAELQAVMEVGMSLTSQNEHPLTNGVRSGIRESGNHAKEGDEKKDEEKPNGKRKSLLLTPKKVSARINQSNNYQVTVNKPKPVTSSTSGRPSSAQSHIEKDNKKTYTPSSWRNDKNSNGTAKISVIPRRKSVEGKPSRASDVKNHVNTGRYSADATHLVQKLQPILDVKNKAESTSSMEVDPGSISSSNRSMRSELTMSSNTSKTSAKAVTNGKPVNKATLSLRHSSDRRHERKPSSSSMASDHSQRTGSRASVASRPSSRSDGSREEVFVSKPAPTSTTQTKARVTRTTGGKSSTRTSQGTTGTTTTTVDAAPSRKTALSKKTSTPADQQAKKTSVTQKDSIPNGRPGSKTKPHPLGVSTSPPDLVYTSLVNGEASLEIKRLESLCESRTKELGAARLQLKQTVQGFDAMSVLVQYLTQEVNAFSVPKLKRQCEELEKEVSITSAKLAHQRDEITRLQDQLDIESHNHQEEKLRLDHLHREEVKGLEETLRAKHAKDLQTLDNKHTQDIRQLHDDHQQEMCDMTASHQSLIRDIEDQHADHISQMNQSHLDHLEEVIRDKDDEMEVIKHDAEVKIRELQDEVFKWKYQCEKQTTRTLELEEALQKDDDTKVQAAIAQYKHLPDEVESMKAVLEIRSKEIHELRKCKMALEKELETIPAKDERIKMLSAKVEDLSALMQRKTEYERQLSSEHVHLRESYERESHVNKRLSMENEELMWKLNQGESTSPGCLTPPLRYRAMSSPSHSGTKTGFSRSSSTESHESGVFSPNHPQ